jgi:endonuclease III
VNPAKRRAIFERFARANPHPKGELDWATPFQLLIAVILSAQATDRSVNAATATLFKLAPGPREMLALGREGIEQHIRTIGLFRSKARHVEETCRALLADHAGEVPSEREALERLPGVGRKTANVILNIAFGQPTIAVDTHLFRLGNRIPLAPGRTPLEVEQRLLKFVPPEYLLHAHHWLILHGRYVCKAVKPDCPSCLINDLCEYRKKTPAPAPD